MKTSPLHILAALAVLVLAMAGGWLATSRFQEVVPIVPGVQGCWRLEGTARQTSCLSDEFESGAAKAARSQDGADRDTAVIAYVRRAEKLAAGDERLAGLCHPAMHDLGRAQGRRAAADERTPAFPGGSTQLCTAGYVHGLSEGYLESSPTADVAAVFPKLCHEADARTGCAHGIGHAIVRSEGDERADTVAKTALARCEELPGTFSTNCHDGVFMELAMRTTPAPVPVDDYVATCEAASTVERELACWAYLGLNLSSNDVPTADVPSACMKASVPGQFTCIEGYGRDLGAAKVEGCTARDVQGTPLRERCVDGAIGLQVGSGHVTGAEARRACESLEPAALASYCTSAVGRYLTGRAAVERT